MADPITDADLVAFCNEQIRPLADTLIHASMLIQTVLTIWTARQYSSRFPNDTTPIGDGAPGDGRPPITGADINGTIAIANQVVGMQSANNNANLAQILKVAVNVR